MGTNTLPDNVIKAVVTNMIRGAYGPLPRARKSGESFYPRVHKDVKQTFNRNIGYGTIRWLKDVALDSNSIREAIKVALEQKQMH